MVRTKTGERQSLPDLIYHKANNQMRVVYTDELTGPAPAYIKGQLSGLITGSLYLNKSCLNRRDIRPWAHGLSR